MKLILTLLVRDEIDIIQSNLEYHLSQGVASIIVTDNGSVDGTRDILQNYADKKLIHLIDEPPSDFSQHRWVTRMAGIAYEVYRANWIIHADADEFFVWRKGKLKEAFKTIPKKITHFMAKRTDFVPFEGRKMTLPVPQGMVYRKAVSLNLAGYELPPKVIHRGRKDAVITQGNHSVTFKKSRQMDQPGPIEVFHYPIRSPKQFESKVRNGGSGYDVNRELDKGVGFHKRDWYKLLKQGKLSDLYYEKYFFTRTGLKKALKGGEIIEDRLLSV